MDAGNDLATERRPFTPDIRASAGAAELAEDGRAEADEDVRRSVEDDGRVERDPWAGASRRIGAEDIACGR
jgi:hypothetical protein